MRSNLPPRAPLFIALAATTIIAPIAGCSDDEPTPTVAAPADETAVPVQGDRRIPFTPADDVAFIDFFVDHHTRAIEMATHVVERGERTDVREMAQNVITVQRGEIDEMRRARAELTGTADSPPGPIDVHMMAEMEEMARLSGEMLDRMFLADMIAHHAAGIAPAERSTSRLQRADMRALAQRIFDAQSKEIGEMKSMLTELPEEIAAGAESSLDGDRRVPLTPGNDVVFIDFFVTHHEAAVEMASMVVERGGREEIKAMARSMVEMQSGEIAQMRAARLALTGVEQSPAPPPDPYMSREMERMRSLSGDALDQAFLIAMTAHHAAALTPALRARAFLQREDMSRLATAMFEAQASEIGEMSSARTNGT